MLTNWYDFIGIRFDADNGSGGSDSPKPDGDDSDEDDSDDEPLGEAGKKALEKEREARRKAEAQLRKAKAEAKAKAATATPDEKEEARIRQEAKAEALKEVNERLVKAAIRVAAAGKLANAEDAVALIDWSDFEVDDDGNPDADEVEKAIADLLKDRPYLAGKTASKKSGGVDGRGGKGDDKPDMNALLRAAAKGG